MAAHCRTAAPPSGPASKCACCRRHAAGGAAARVAGELQRRRRLGGPARHQPLHAGRAVPAPAALLRGVPLGQDGGVGAAGPARGRGRVPLRARAQERPAPVEAAVRGGALRPHQHGALRLRPRRVRAHRAHLPPGAPAAGRVAPPGRRLAAAGRAPAMIPPLSLYILYSSRSVHFDVCSRRSLTFSFTEVEIAL